MKIWRLKHFWKNNKLVKKKKILKYQKLEVTDYVIEDKQEMFSISIKINDIPCFFGNTIDCEMGCKQLFNSEHILTCLPINEEQTILKYEHILKGTMRQKNQIKK